MACGRLDLWSDAPWLAFTWQDAGWQQDGRDALTQCEAGCQGADAVCMAGWL